jgi:hypothetical protein
MSYEAWQLEDGRVEIRCTSGQNAHIVRRPDGAWTVEEDERHRVFPTRGDAMTCARKIALDPDC